MGNNQIKAIESSIFLWNWICCILSWLYKAVLPFVSTNSNTQIKAILCSVLPCDAGSIVTLHMVFLTFTLSKN